MITRLALVFGVALHATIAVAQAPVAIPDGFETFAEVVEADNALYSYRRGTPDEDEQSIVIFRNRFSDLDDPQHFNALRQLLAADCDEGAVTYTELALDPPFLRAECPDRFVAYARILGADQGICVIGLALRQDGVDAHELALRSWIEAIEVCAPEAAWSD